MNDLTFGATLLALFAMLVTTVMIEITSVPQRGTAAVPRPVHSAGQAAKTAAKDCTTIALAQPNTER